MTYSDFSLAKVRDQFDLTLDESKNLFAAVVPVTPSEALTVILADYIFLAIAIATEKARSEFLIAPLLAEVRRQLDNRIFLFSGNDFSVDLSLGLHGFCNYIISASPEQLLMTTGTNWKFLTLSGKIVSIDKVEYFINQPDKILGILTTPFESVRSLTQP